MINIEHEIQPIEPCYCAGCGLPCALLICPICEEIASRHWREPKQVNPKAVRLKFRILFILFFLSLCGILVFA